MELYHLKIKLLSDTTFGRGDGVAGLVDQEVEHDAYGFPFLRGRTFKGLLSEECDNIIAAFTDESLKKHWQKVACAVFGISGSVIDTIGAIRVGDAVLPDDLRQAVAYQLKEQTLTKTEVLESLTTIRRQTAMNPNGVATPGSLRSFRVVIRQLEFSASLHLDTNTVEIDGVSISKNEMLSLLAVGTLALRHLGSGRNRGRGHVQCSLCDNQGNDITRDYLSYFDLAEEKHESN
ncbi:MAG: RAMP superfamily protein [Okeania sp. SIO3I5]|uniref:RAMP superfamily CRISPR-associated protein n=1 Tax=Okeania sp. SIO3I5 TaxID=2607805 RepID=UPI0013B5C9BD|nr:RAMP superfamily CRISPR-associated protein [Okeania sp. SIO3I5]NEQ36900.1 RAMP superfamily protein [Okeania sp. SIO3I5]